MKGERKVSELAAEWGVPPTMIHQEKRSLLEGVAGIFERGARAVVAAEVAEEPVRDLHAKIGDRSPWRLWFAPVAETAANDFRSGKLKPRIGK